MLFLTPCLGSLKWFDRLVFTISRLGLVSVSIRKFLIRCCDLRLLSPFCIHQNRKGKLLLSVERASFSSLASKAKILICIIVIYVFKVWWFFIWNINIQQMQTTSKINQQISLFFFYKPTFGCLLESSPLGVRSFIAIALDVLLVSLA